MITPLDVLVGIGKNYQLYHPLRTDQLALDRSTSGGLYSIFTKECRELVLIILV